MRYYKLIDDTVFIGVSTSLDLRRIHPTRLNLLACDEDNAQYISCNDELYRADWMLPEVITDSRYPIVDVIEIQESEYNALYQTIGNGETVIIEPEEDEHTEIVEPVDPAVEVTIEFVKEKKIAAMSKICNETIETGFDVVLSDGNTHHFSLTIQDRLDLLTSSVMLASGDAEISYHADGEAWQYYSASDMKNIISVATLFQKYHLSYFNSLRSYINSLTTISEISDIVYGITIPEEYQNDVLKDLISQIPVKSNV